MADDTRNILLRITGTAAQAKKTLQEVAAHVRSLPEEKDIRVVLRTKEVLNEAQQFTKKFNRTWRQTEVVESFEQARAAIRSMRKEVEGAGRPLLTTQKFELDIDQAASNFEILKRHLESIDKRKISARATLEVDDAIASAALYEQTLRGLPNEFTTTLTLEQKKDVLKELGDMDKELRRLLSVFSSAHKPTSSFGDSVDAVFTSIRRFVPLIAGFSLLIGISLVSAFVAVGASAVAAAGGIASFATSLLAALGPGLVLAINLMNRFAQVMFAFTAAQNLQKAEFADQAKGIADTGKAAGQAARDAEQAAQRMRAIRDARQQITSAERRYKEAVEEARQGIRDALREQREAYEALRDTRVDAARDIQEAESRVDDATRGIAEAIVEANEEIADAARDARDALFDLRDAQLDVADATDKVSDLERDLAKLLERMGAADPAAALKKLTDVDLEGFDPGAFILEAQLNASPEEIEELDDLTRELERAKLDLEKANVKVGDSETDLAKKQAEAIRLQKEGIGGVEAYRQAVDALHEAKKSQIATEEEAAERISAAEEKLATARREANRLIDEGVKKNAAVIAAAEGVRDAHEGLEAAISSANAAAVGQAAAIEAPLSQLSRWRFEMGQLSKAEQEFVKRLIAGMKALQIIFQPGTDAILGALNRGLDAAGFAILNFRGQLNSLGVEWARQIDLFRQELFDADTMLQMQDFIESGATFTRLLGRGFRDLTSAALNFAHAGLGPAEGILRQINESLGTMRERTEDTRALEKVTRGMAASLRIWLDAIGAVTAAFAEFVAIVKPFGDEFVKWITDSVNAFREWMKTEEGREQIEAFFRDTLPFAKSLLTFLGKIGVAFFLMFQAAAPFLKATFDGFNVMLDVVIFLLRMFNKIPGPIRAALFALLPFVGAASKIPLIGGLITGSFSRVIAVISGVTQAISGVLPAVINAFKGFGEAIINIFTGAFNPVFELLAGSKFAKIGTDIINGIVGGVKGAVGLWLATVTFIFERWFTLARTYFTTAFTLGTTILGKIVSGVKAIGETWLSVATFVFGRLWSAIRTVFPAAVSIGVDILERIVQGVKDIGKKFFGAGADVVQAVRDSVGRKIADVVDIGVQIVKGIAKGIFEAIPDMAKEAGGFLVKKLKDAAGVKSPSKKTVPLGRELMRGIAVGMEKESLAEPIKKELRSLEGLADFQLPEIQGSLQGDISISDSFTQGIEAELPTFATLGEDVLANLLSGFADQTPVEDSASTFNEQLAASVEGGAAAFFAVGLFALTQVTLGLRTLIPLLADFGRWLHIQLTAAVGAVRTQLHAIGTGATATITQGMRDGTQVGLATFAVLLQANTAIQVHKQDFRTIGEWVAGEIKAGMVNAVNTPKEIDAFADTLIKSVKERFGIKSPSTVFRGIGENITEGLILGLWKKDPAGVIREQFGGMTRFARGLVLNAPDWLPGSGLSSFSDMAKLGLELWDRGDMKLGSIPDRLFDEIFSFPASVLDRYFNKQSPGDIASIIVAVGKHMRAQTVEFMAAMAAALVESNLRNVPAGKGDRDSVGVFQQRPSQGWGTIKELLNPFFAARQFFKAAIKLRPHGGDASTLAQNVQKSAFPERYAMRMAEAMEWLNKLGIEISGNLKKLSGAIGGATLVALGRELQKKGYHVSEHPAFGGVRGKHDPDGYHYVGRAIDVNHDQGDEMKALDALYDFLKNIYKFRKKIVELLWRTTDHWDHLHVAMASGGLVTGPVSALVGEGRHHEAVLPLSEAVMRRLAAAIVAQMEIQMPRMVTPQLNPAALAGLGVGSGGGDTVQHFNIPAPAGNPDIAPDPKIVSALIATEVRRHGGLRS